MNELVSHRWRHFQNSTTYFAARRDDTRLIGSSTYDLATCSEAGALSPLVSRMFLPKARVVDTKRGQGEAPLPFPSNQRQAIFTDPY